MSDGRAVKTGASGSVTSWMPPSSDKIPSSVAGEKAVGPHRGPGPFMEGGTRPDVVLLDSRDSFTYNLAQAFAELGAAVLVVNADDVQAADVRALDPRLVCVGPGPRGPADLPHLEALVGALAGQVPLFGVCLGLQVLVRASGGEVRRAETPIHGKRDAIWHDGTGVFAGLQRPLWVMRYHSLIASEVPPTFAVTAWDGRGQVMGVRRIVADEHAEAPASEKSSAPSGAQSGPREGHRVFLEAVQFHPESVGTAGGMVLLANAMAASGIPVRAVPVRPGAVPGIDDDGPDFAEALYRASADASDLASDDAFDRAPDGAPDRAPDLVRGHPEHGR